MGEQTRIFIRIGEYFLGLTDDLLTNGITKDTFAQAQLYAEARFAGLQNSKQYPGKDLNAMLDGTPFSDSSSYILQKIEDKLIFLPTSLLDKSILRSTYHEKDLALLRESSLHKASEFRRKTKDHLISIIFRPAR